MSDFNRTLSFNVGVAQETSIEAAILYDELAFLAPRGKRTDGWVYKTYAEMQERLPLSEYQIRKAYRELKDRGWIDTKLLKANGSPTIHFKLVQSLRMDTEKTSETMDTEKTSETINSNSPATHNTIGKNTTDSKNPSDVRKIYNLYLKRVIIPTRLKEEMNSLPLEKLMEMAATRYKLSPKRREIIQRRLKDAKAPMIAAAIIGYSREPWAMGETDRNWIFSLDEYLCRNYENIEKGAALYEQQQKGKTSDPYAGL